MSAPAKVFLARRSSSSFGLKALPFLAMMGLGSWGLAQFLKMPVQMKDARARDKRLGKEKFDLSVEHEVTLSQPGFGNTCSVCPSSFGLQLTSALLVGTVQRLQKQLDDKQTNYENVPIPGPKPTWRVPAD